MGSSPVDDASADAWQRLRSVVDTAADGIITIDQHGLIETINPAGAKMFGYQPSELIGRNVSMLMPFPHAQRHDQYMADYLRTGRAKIIGVGRELQAKRRDGSLFPMRLAVSEIQLVGRRAFTGIISDLSDRRQLERQVLETASAEQRRIGQDLHDGLCQQLGGISFLVERIKRRAEKGEPIDLTQLEKIQQLLKDSTYQMRQIAHGLQPVHFRTGGLPQALRELAMETSDRFRIHCKARCWGEANVEDVATADHLYRIAQEATGNAIKHGKAQQVRIQLSVPRAGGLNLMVLDNGTGFGAMHRSENSREGASGATASPGSSAGCPVAHSPSSGMGLRIMKYRADAIGADFRIRPRTHTSGVVVWCTLAPRA